MKSYRIRGAATQRQWVSTLLGATTVGFVLVCLGAATVNAQVEKKGAEFPVNTFTANTQIEPDLAHTAAGEFVVVWTSYGADGASGSVAVQRFTAGAAKIGNEFVANTYTTSAQFEPAVGTDANGRFVVVWTNYAPQDGSSYGIFAQRFNANGGVRGGEFQVNTNAIGRQEKPDIGVAPNGSFVVVWKDSGGHDGQGEGVLARRFAADGNPLGEDFVVNSGTRRNQRNPSISMAANGSFVIAFGSQGLDDPADLGSFGIYARRFDDTASPLDNEFRVNTFTTGNQTQPDVALQPGGGFVVVWQDAAQFGANTGIVGRLFDAAGDPASDEFVVHSNATSTKENPRVATGSDGTFVVAWEASAQDGSSRGVFARRFGTDASPLGGEFQVNSFTLGSQYRPALSDDQNGEVVIVWQSPQDGHGDGVYGQRYDTSIQSSADCGDAIALVATAEPRAFSARAVTATDSLAILQAAVGILNCALCVCDVNGSNTLSATDALIVLQFSVGQPVSLLCPPCD